MSDVQTSTEAAPSYGSDAEGISQAAADFRKANPENDGIEAPDVELPPNRVDLDGNNKGVSIKQAAEGLNKYREAQAEKRALFEQAAGLSIGATDAPLVQGHADAGTEPAPEARQVNEEAAARQHLETQQLHQQASEFINDLEAAHARLRNEFAQSFPELVSAHDMQMLRATNPERYAQAFQLIQAAELIRAEHGHVGQLLQADIGTQWNNWSAQQDAEFESRHPELKDPNVSAEAQRMVLKALTDTGLTKEEVAYLWHGKASFSLRSSQAQDILLDAARYRALKANANGKVEALRSKPVPVLKPGVARDRMSPASEEVVRLQREVSRNPTPRNMATLYAAQKRANG